MTPLLVQSVGSSGLLLQVVGINKQTRSLSSSGGHTEVMRWETSPEKVTVTNKSNSGRSDYLIVYDNYKEPKLIYEKADASK
jgi:hypothetical protein